MRQASVWRLQVPLIDTPFGFDMKFISQRDLLNYRLERFHVMLVSFFVCKHDPRTAAYAHRV